MPFSEFFGKPEVQNIASAVARGYLGSQPNGASTLASIDAQNRAKQAAAQRQSLFAQATQGMSPEQAAQFQLISQDGLDKSFAARFNPRDFERDLSTLKANNGADFLRARMAQQAGLKSQEGFLNPSELAGSGRIAAGLDVDAKSQLTEDGLNSRKELTETGLNRRADQTEAGLNSRKGAQLSFDERKHLADNALARSKYLEDVRQFGAEHALDEMKLSLERDKFENPRPELSGRAKLALDAGLPPGSEEFKDFLLRDTSQKVTINNEKPFTESQAKLALFSNMMDSVTPVLERFEASFAPDDYWRNLAGDSAVANAFVKTPEYRQYQSAQRQWAEGILRIQTGAAATEPEINRVINTYFPQAGDDPRTVAFKREQRNGASTAIKTAGQGRFGEAPGTDFTSFGDPARPSAATPAPPEVPSAGAVQGGYRFKGGDPADPANWEAVN